VSSVEHEEGGRCAYRAEDNTNRNRNGSTPYDADRYWFLSERIVTSEGHTKWTARPRIEAAVPLVKRSAEATGRRLIWDGRARHCECGPANNNADERDDD